MAVIDNNLFTQTAGSASTPLGDSTYNHPTQHQNINDELNSIEDTLVQGYVRESATVTYVSSSSFTVSGDVTEIYTPGRIVRFSDGTTGIVSSSSYSSPNTTVTMLTGTVPSNLSYVDIAIQAKGQTAGLSSRVLGDNNIPVVSQKDSTGTARSVVKVNSSDILEIGDTNLSGIKLNIPSLEQGDIFYVDSNLKLTRLPAGTSGYYLKTNGASANPEWASVSVSSDGWIDANETWTYASSTTFTVSGDVRGKYQKGDKIELTQSSTVKYFYIINVSYSAPNTTITITGGVDYTLANTTITNNYYSKAENPQGFPKLFMLNASCFNWDTNTIDNGTNGQQPSLSKSFFIINGIMITLFVSLGTSYKNNTAEYIRLNFPPTYLPSINSSYISTFETLGYGRFQNGSNKGATVRTESSLTTLQISTADYTTIADNTALSSSGFWITYVY
jgi:hypothetical protein